MSTATSTPAAPAERPATYRSVFAVGEFRLLFGGNLMYVLGFTFEILGLSVLVYAQTRSAFLASFAYSMGFAPQVLGGAFLTALADRLAPRTVITAGLLLRAVPGLLIGAVPGMPVAVMLAWSRQPPASRRCSPRRSPRSCPTCWTATSTCSAAQH